MVGLDGRHSFRSAVTAVEEKKGDNSQNREKQAMRMHKGFILTGSRVVKPAITPPKSGDETTLLQAILRTRMMFQSLPKESNKPSAASFCLFICVRACARAVDASVYCVIPTRGDASRGP